MSIVTTSLRLGLIGVVVAAALAGLDAMTRDRVQMNERRGALQSFVDVTGDARLAQMRGLSMPPLTICSAAGAPLYRIYGRSAHGYAGVIQLLLGINAAGTLTGVRVISHRETPGIGDAVDAAKSAWIHSFDGKSVTSVVLAGDGGSIDAISGASVTSRAVVNGVHDALADAAVAPLQSCSNVVDE